LAKGEVLKRNSGEGKGKREDERKQIISKDYQQVSSQDLPLSFFTRAF
jgi:hypothetical protein